MNIVFIAPFGYMPKATVSARMLPMASALVRSGHHVTVLVPPYDNPSDSQSKWNQAGVQIENMHLRTNRAGGPASGALLSLSMQMARRVVMLNPDVVHVFKPVGTGALAMYLLHGKGWRRFVVDSDDWEGSGGWLNVNPYPIWQKLLMRWQEGWTLRHAQAVTCASTVLVEQSRLMISGNTPITLLPNGPDDRIRDIVSHAESERDALRKRFGWGAEPVLIYTGTVPINHDLDIAVTALHQVLASHHDVRWVIIAAGDGLGSLQTLIRQAGLDAQVQYYGFMPHDSMLQYLVAADIAIYPYRDTLINRAKCSGKVIDYLACGKPVVVSDVGMNHAYIEQGKSGVLTPPGDAPAFTTALIQMLDHPTDASSMGRMGQQHLWSHFAWDGRIDQLVALYQAIIAPSKPSFEPRNYPPTQSISS